MTGFLIFVFVLVVIAVVVITWLVRRPPGTRPSSAWLDKDYEPEDDETQR
ncbi:MAG: hypothetical protein WAJ85_05560 [Candidatus Baltobacteraceae bacterium]|jgi:hypothetical protein